MSTVVVKESYRLGNLDFARYFDHAIGVLLDRFRPIAVAFLVIAVPPLLVYFLVDLAFGFSSALDVTEEELMDPENMLDFWVRGFGITMVFSLAYHLFIMPLNFAVMYLVGMHYLGTQVTMREAFRFILPRLPALLVAYILYGIGVYVGMLMCIVPGILVAVWFYLAGPAIIFERAGPLDGLNRSRHLVSQGEFLRIVFVILVITISGMQLGVVSELVPNPALTFMLSTLASGALQLFSSALTTIIYFSLRAKHESLDLEILAGHIELEAAAETPAL